MHDDHSHDHHDHEHSHSHTHDHDHPHGPGHNHAHGEGEHLHSHLHGSPEDERREEIGALCAAFVEGFRAASDKPSYLKFAGVPLKRIGEDGLTMYLVDAAITSNWQLGTASPAFASRELSYLPYPGAMVAERETMIFTYVSLTGRVDVDLAEFAAGFRAR